MIVRGRCDSGDMYDLWEVDVSYGGVVSSGGK